MISWWKEFWRIIVASDASNSSTFVFSTRARLCRFACQRIPTNWTRILFNTNCHEWTINFYNTNWTRIIFNTNCHEWATNWTRNIFNTNEPLFFYNYNYWLIRGNSCFSMLWSMQINEIRVFRVFRCFRCSHSAKQK